MIKRDQLTIREYFPNDHIHVLSFPEKTKVKTPKHSPKRGKDNEEELTEMADLILKRVDVGVFKSTDCQPIIRENWPNHAMSAMPSPQFGIEFGNKVWPILKNRGVRRQETKPRKYEMTQEAKRKITDE